MENLIERADQYASEKTNELMAKAIAQAYADGYRDGYEDCEANGRIDETVDVSDMGLPSKTRWSLKYLEKEDGDTDNLPYGKAVKLGIPTIVEDTNITEFLSLNNWDYSASYKASRIFMLDKKNTYPTLKYFIDIHRDSVGKDLTSVKINNKDYARILFVVGLEHDNYKKNLELVNNINKLFNDSYPGLSRGVYKKEGINVNGIYNQDVSENAMLIEVGGVDNNIEEVMNTMNAISDVISKYIGDNH